MRCLQGLWSDCPFSHRVVASCALADSKYLWTGAIDGIIVRWDRQPGDAEPPQPQPCTVLAFHTAPITLLLELPQWSRILLSADASGAIAVWEADTGLCLESGVVPALIGADCVHGAALPSIGRIGLCVAKPAPTIHHDAPTSPMATANSEPAAAAAAKVYKPSVRSEDPDAKFARLMGGTASTALDDDAETPVATNAPPAASAIQMLLLDPETLSVSRALDASAVLPVLSEDALRGETAERPLCMCALPGAVPTLEAAEVTGGAFAAAAAEAPATGVALAQRNGMARIAEESYAANDLRAGDEEPHEVVLVATSHGRVLVWHAHGAQAGNTTAAQLGRTLATDPLPLTAAAVCSESGSVVLATAAGCAIFHVASRHSDIHSLPVAYAPVAKFDVLASGGALQALTGCAFASRHGAASAVVWDRAGGVCLLSAPKAATASSTPDAAPQARASGEHAQAAEPQGSASAGQHAADLPQLRIASQWPCRVGESARSTPTRPGKAAASAQGGCDVVVIGDVASAQQRAELRGAALAYTSCVCCDEQHVVRIQSGAVHLASEPPGSCAALQNVTNLAKQGHRRDAVALVQPPEWGDGIEAAAPAWDAAASVLSLSRLGAKGSPGGGVQWSANLHSCWPDGTAGVAARCGAAATSAAFLPAGDGLPASIAFGDSTGGLSVAPLATAAIRRRAAGDEPSWLRTFCELRADLRGHTGAITALRQARLQRAVVRHSTAPFSAPPTPMPQPPSPQPPFPAAQRAVSGQLSDVTESTPRSRWRLALSGHRNASHRSGQGAAASPRHHHFSLRNMFAQMKLPHHHSHGHSHRQSQMARTVSAALSGMAGSPKQQPSPAAGPPEPPRLSLSDADPLCTPRDASDRITASVAPPVVTTAVAEEHVLLSGCAAGRVCGWLLARVDAAAVDGAQSARHPFAESCDVGTHAAPRERGERLFSLQVLAEPVWDLVLPPPRTPSHQQRCALLLRYSLAPA